MDADTKKFFENLVSPDEAEPFEDIPGKPVKVKGSRSAKQKSNSLASASTPVPALPVGRPEEKKAALPEEPEEDEAEEALEPSGLADEREGQLAIDVYQTADAIIVESPIAGVNGDDLDINITNESVTVRGRRERRKEVAEDDYFYQECYWGRFARSVILPQEIDPDKAEASIKNGVLTIVMPKVTRQKQKKLKVKLE